MAAQVQQTLYTCCLYRFCLRELSPPHLRLLWMAALSSIVVYLRWMADEHYSVTAAAPYRNGQMQNGGFVTLCLHTHSKGHIVQIELNSHILIRVRSNHRIAMTAAFFSCIAAVSGRLVPQDSSTVILSSPLPLHPFLPSRSAPATLSCHRHISMTNAQAILTFENSSLREFAFCAAVLVLKMLVTALLIRYVRCT